MFLVMHASAYSDFTTGNIHVCYVIIRPTMHIMQFAISGNVFFHELLAFTACFFP